MAVNKQMEKTPMPEQDPLRRASNFEEVALGYTEEMAVNEAQRCLHCKNRPCVSGCPVNVQIPDFIDRIVSGDYEGAYQTVLFRRFAGGYALRKHSVKPNAYAVLRGNR